MSISAAAYSKLALSSDQELRAADDDLRLPAVPHRRADNPAKSVKELAEWAKKNPDKSNYASSSPAFILATELLKLESGMPATMIPYKSSGQMALSVVSGDTTLALPSSPPAVAQIKAGKARALAVTGDKRAPELAGRAEHGRGRASPKSISRLWSGVFVGAKTPPAIVAKLEDTFRRAIKDPAVAGSSTAWPRSRAPSRPTSSARSSTPTSPNYRKVIEAAKLVRMMRCGASRNRIPLFVTGSCRRGRRRVRLQRLESDTGRPIGTALNVPRPLPGHVLTPSCCRILGVVPREPLRTSRRFALGLRPTPDAADQGGACAHRFKGRTSCPVNMIRRLMLGAAVGAALGLTLAGADYAGTGAGQR